MRKQFWFHLTNMFTTVSKFLLYFICFAVIYKMSKISPSIESLQLKLHLYWFYYGRAGPVIAGPINSDV